jgi:hypothetical protein
MRIETAYPQRAARALLAHIRERYGTIPAFCAAKGMDRLKVQRAVKGKPRRMDVVFAGEIEVATDGAVPAPWWAEPAEVEPTGTEGGR